jgi:crossover junction endodeoxyribonuclease RuvC
MLRRRASSYFIIRKPQIERLKGPIFLCTIKFMKVLGIDPGTGRLGWGIVTHEKGIDSLEICGCFETKANTDLPIRLEKIYLFLQELIKKYKPDAVSVESLFFATNAKTAFDVSAARGVILLAAQQANLPIFQYTPLQIKSSIVGYGQAEKNQIQFMVTKILHLKEIPKPDDAADAVAIALTHIFRARSPK